MTDGGSSTHSASSGDTHGGAGRSLGSSLWGPSTGKHFQENSKQN